MIGKLLMIVAEIYLSLVELLSLGFLFIYLCIKQ